MDTQDREQCNSDKLIKQGVRLHVNGPEPACGVGKAVAIEIVEAGQGEITSSLSDSLSRLLIVQAMVKLEIRLRLSTRISSTVTHSIASSLAYSAADKAATFVETEESQYQSNADIIYGELIEHVKGFLKDYFAPCPTDFHQPFFSEEVSKIVSKAKARQTSRRTDISARCIQAIPAVFILSLVTIFNSAIRLRHFPNSWKTAKVILIPKPGKTNLLS